MNPPPWFHTSGAHAGVQTPLVDTRQHTRAFERGCGLQVVLASRGVAAMSHGAPGHIGGWVGALRGLRVELAWCSRGTEEGGCRRSRAVEGK